MWSEVSEAPTVSLVPCTVPPNPRISYPAASCFDKVFSSDSHVTWDPALVYTGAGSVFMGTSSKSIMWRGLVSKYYSFVVVSVTFPVNS